MSLMGVSVCPYISIPPKKESSNAAQNATGPVPSRKRKRSKKKKKKGRKKKEALKRYPSEYSQCFPVDASLDDDGSPLFRNARQNFDSQDAV